MSEGQKLHPQIMLMLPFSEYASEEVVNSDMPAWNTDHSAISCLQSPFSMPQTTLLLYLINISSLLHLGRADWRSVLLSSFLALVKKSFLHRKPQHLSIWLAVHWANETNSVTNG